MAALDRDERDALRRARAAVRKIHAAADSTREVGGCWQDIDSYLQGRFEAIASELSERAAVLAAELDETYPARRKKSGEVA
jgi:hypothetical protein